MSDHNEIRASIRKVRSADPGSEPWWAAVLECREANDDHMDEEEREDLADFRRNADLYIRHDIAVQFLAYEAGRPGGGQGAGWLRRRQQLTQVPHGRTRDGTPVFSQCWAPSGVGGAGSWCAQAIHNHFFDRYGGLLPSWTSPPSRVTHEGAR